jgi:hypothetical protein
MPDHRSYQDPFYGWTVPKSISLCVQKLKECSSLPFEAIRKLISSKKKKKYLLIILYIICSFECLVSEAQILNNEKTSSSSLEILMKFSKDYSISIEHLIIIFNGFVHVIRLALKPPAAFLKSDVKLYLINFY